MKNRKWLIAMALLLCAAMVAAVTPSTVAYIVDRANTVRNTFRVVYRPPEDIAVPVRIHKTVQCMGEDTIGPEGFSFCLENLDTGAMLTLSSRADGWASGNLVFTANDVDKTYHYRLYELNGGREHVTYDETVHDMTIVLQLDEQHEMFATVTMDGAAVSEIEAEFVNLYQMMELPDTGDDEQPFLMLALLMFSAAGMLLLRRGRMFRRL